MSEWLERVARATVKVKLSDTNGQGVIVPGGFVLTAAHCVEWSCDGSMALGDRALVTVESLEGESFRLDVVSLDPRSDIAVLASPDEQEMPEVAALWANFCDTVDPVEIDESALEAFNQFPVHVRTHFKTWEKCRAMICRPASHLLTVMCSGNQIQGGTSGGPVVNERGAIVGIVSTMSDVNQSEDASGNAARPHLALPRWIFDEIKNSPIMAIHE